MRILDSEGLPEIATPATPASGVVSLYAKSDHKVYAKDSTGAETALGGAGASGSSLTSLTEDTAPLTTDIIYVVHDPAGTPADRKVQLGNLGGLGKLMALGY